VEDRRLFFETHRVRAFNSTTNGVIEGPSIMFNSGKPWAGRNDHEIFLYEVFGTFSRCCFYDTVTLLQSSPMMYLGIESEAVTYAPEFGVIVSLHGDTTHEPTTMRIWSLENVPTAISNPVLIAGSTKQGYLATYQVRVLSDHSEPCPDELVDWSLSGAGILLATQSTTDEDGYATIRVQFGLAETGDMVLGASVSC